MLILFFLRFLTIPCPEKGYICFIVGFSTQSGAPSAQDRDNQTWHITLLFLSHGPLKHTLRKQQVAQPGTNWSFLFPVCKFSSSVWVYFAEAWASCARRAASHAQLLSNAHPTFSNAQH